MTDTIIVTAHGEVERGFAVPSDEFERLRAHLHNDIRICEDALRVPVHTDKTKSLQTSSGRTYSIGDDWNAEECEFCTHYAARLLAKFELQARS